ncbi:SHOCT domain-containing protein [Haloquadratum walsbyi]|uniref:DUF2078 family protein n=1 Tax=Haloquadratum walsbyi (strain DSM 16854 / JCM 12705 / C23) TaxID=768065 RepID=G0LGI7_HALWC|nr:SHOCT domain-containing protein [Haloquadratum walsbyi]CCC39207.1 DUF2078 family protein [Haloquadratum walsbyi C23]
MNQSVIKRFESLSTQQTLALTALGGIMIGAVLFFTAVIFIEPLIVLLRGGGPPVSAGPPPEASAPAHAGPHRAAPHGGSLSGLLLTIFGLISTVVAISLVMIYQTVTFAHDSNSDAEHSDDDPLRTLRHRYASGEIDDDEFKRRMSRVSETESSSTQEQSEQIPANPDTQIE